MKVLLHLIETSGPGGAERMLTTLVENLDKSRYASIICLLSDGWLNTHLRKRGLETVVIPQTRSFDVVWLLRLVRLIKRRRVSLIHAHEFAMNTYGSLASAIARIPAISTVHGKNYYWQRWRRRIAYRFVAKRSRMVAVSEDIRRFLVSRVGINDNEISTIYNGVDIDPYRLTSGARHAVRQELGINDYQPVIGTVGNLYPVKGHSYLLEAAARVTETFPDAMFVIAGRGELLKQLHKTAGELALKTNVRFLGFREDIPALLQAMDIFVLPSLSEGLPISMLEAMAAGKPVVATDVGGNPEVVIDGQTGLLAPAAHADALADKILLLLRNPDLMYRLGKAGANRVEREFAVDGMVAKYQELYGRC